MKVKGLVVSPLVSLVWCGALSHPVQPGRGVRCEQIGYKLPVVSETVGDELAGNEARRI